NNHRLGPKSREGAGGRRAGSSAGLSAGGGHTYKPVLLPAGCVRDNLNVCLAGPFLTRFAQTKQPNSPEASSPRRSRPETGGEDRPAPWEWMATPPGVSPPG